MEQMAEQLKSAPLLQLIFLVLGMLTSTVGGNLLSIAHCRRTGRKWRFFGNVFAEMIQYSRKEWAAFFAIIGLTVVFFAAAMAVS